MATALIAAIKASVSASYANSQEFGSVDATSEVVYEYALGSSAALTEVPFQVGEVEENGAGCCCRW